MPHDPSKAIEAHFTARDNDGDFVSSDPETPYKFWPPPIGGRLVYSTKPDAARRILSDSFGLIARYGLPCAADVDWLRKLAGRPRILFLGDLDPQDLMIFAWLRAHLGPRRIEHFGIGDRLLDERAIVVPDSYWIKLSRSERRSIPVLDEAFPDFRNVVGQRCAAELENGRKLELEALVGLLHAAKPRDTI